jgi:hypothetical protein
VSRRRSKLQIRWLSPRRVVLAFTDSILIVEDLRNDKPSTHEVRRLKLFTAKDLVATQDLLSHVAYVEGGRILVWLATERKSIEPS